jgi:hypothetical protein
VLIYYAGLGDKTSLDLLIVLYALSRSIIIAWYNVYLVKFIKDNRMLANNYKLQKSIILNFFTVYVFYLEYSFLVLVANKFVESLKEPSINDILPKFIQQWLKNR